MGNSPLTHRPSLVLELPPDRWVYCLRCQKPWPCPDAPADAWRPRINDATPTVG